MMRLSVFLSTQLLVLALTVTATIGVAPGDESELCNDLRSIGAAPTPDYPPNVKPLMDSWNYQNLLPPRPGAVWNQVDLDDKHVPGVTTSWIQNTNLQCNQNVQVCGFTAGPQNNWLITQLINRTLPNGVKLPQVSVLIEYESSGCVNNSCQSSFAFHVYETTNENDSEASNVQNYKHLWYVLIDTSTGKKNASMLVNLKTDYSYFSLGIQDTGSCIAITRILVYYYVCPHQIVNLIEVPETIAPMIPTLGPIDRNLKPVAGVCVVNAVQETRRVPRLTCRSGGNWFVLGRERGCRCARNFVNVSGKSCESIKEVTTESKEETEKPTEGIITETERPTEDCTSWLDWCRTFWLCGTEQDRRVYFAGRPPLCPRHPPTDEPPSEPGICQFNHTEGQCKFDQASTTTTVGEATTQSKKETEKPTEGIITTQTERPTEALGPLYFELKGQKYPNNSQINIADIGEGDENSLKCKTNRLNCCGTRPHRIGEFYYPNGLKVPLKRDGQDFYRNRRDQEVRLHRRSDARTPTGKYRCEIPDEDGDLRNLYINVTTTTE